jgi:hypothetical protein
MRYRKLTVLVLLAAATLHASALAAQPMIERTLMDGSLVRIDPETGKGRIVTPRGAEAMLWNGVHKLRDGSTIIVRDGVVVPDKPMIGARRAVPEPVTAEPCAELERKVCGPAGGCADSQPCRLARDLVEFQGRDRADGRLEAVERTAAQCRQALRQADSFPACAAAPAKALPSAACRDLLERVCGASDQCADAAACRAARQLVDLERDEAQAAPEPGAKLETTRQCREAASDSFFAPCPGVPGPQEPPAP